MDRRLKRTLWLLVLIALAAHSFALAGLVPGALPSTGDTVGGFLPWHQFVRRAFWARGEMPLWDPHLYCGVPFLSNAQSGLFYPPNLLYVLLPENLGLWVFAFAHSVLLMFGSYFLGRTLRLKRRAAFLVAVLLGLGAASPAHLFGGHLTFLPVRAYWPWEALFLIRLLRAQGRGNAFGLAACLTLGLAAGAPQLWLFGLVICAGFFLLTMWGRPFTQWRGTWLPLASCALLTGLCCAPILLPLQELRAWSSHGDSMSFAQATNLSATSRSLFRLLFNDFFGGNSLFMWSLPANGGEDAASLGLAALVLGLLAPLCARKTRAVPGLLIFCALAVAVALGNSTPLYRLLYQHSTIFQTTRVPARWLELWAFGAALLAGYSFDGLLRDPASWEKVRRAFAVVTALCLALLIFCLRASGPWREGAAIILVATRLAPWKAPAIAHGLQTEAAICCFINVICIGGIAWLASFKTRGGLLLGALLGLLAMAPLFSFLRSTRIASPKFVQAATLSPTLVSHYHAGERWIVHSPFGHLNAPLTAGIDALNGYEPFGSAPFFEFAAAAQPNAVFRADFQPDEMTPLWRVAGVTYLLWEPKRFGDEVTDFPSEPIAKEGKWTLKKLDAVSPSWPRAYLTNQVLSVRASKRYGVLTQLADQPHRKSFPVVVEPDFPEFPVQSVANFQVTLKTETPDVLEWALTPHPAAVFVHQAALAPGWVAYVDGQRKPLYRVNGFFRGVAVPENAQHVAIVYDSDTLRFSLFLALGGLGLAAFLLVKERTTTESQRHGEN